MNFEFYCERARSRDDAGETEEKIEKVCFSDCPFCQHYNDCISDGSLEEIKRKYGIKTTDTDRKREYQLVRKWIERSRKNTNFKDWCVRKNEGMVGIDEAGPIPPLEDVEAVLQENSFDFDAEEIWAITRRYFTRKANWKVGPGPTDYKRNLKKLQEALAKLQDGFEQFQNNTAIYTLLQSESGVKLLNYSLSTSRLFECIKEMRSDKSNTLPNYPLFRYIQRLALIYKRSTGLEPTATDGQTTGNPRGFVLFVHTLLSEFHPEVFSN